MLTNQTIRTNSDFLRVDIMQLILSAPCVWYFKNKLIKVCTNVKYIFMIS